MAGVMAYMVGEADLGEDLTSFLSDDDDEDEIDIDDDDDDMYILYDDEPPSYDIVARLKEVNDALQKEIIPPDYEDRDRKVTFKENPIYLEIYTSTGYTDDEDEGEEDDVDDDDGYGDSTEVSDELTEESGVGQKAEVEPAQCSGVQKSQLNDEEPTINPQSEEIEPILPVSDDVTIQNVCAEELDNKSDVTVENLVKEVVCENLESLTNVDVIAEEKAQLQKSKTENDDVVTLVTESKDTIVTPVEPVLIPPAVNVGKSQNDYKKIAVKNPNKIRPRSSSLPPRPTSNSSVSMIMATKGQFHMMTTDDIQVRRRTASPSRVTTSKKVTDRRENGVDSATNNKNNKSQIIPKVDSKTCKLNARNSRSATTEVKLKSPPATPKVAVAVADRRPKVTMPKYVGEGPSRYGLTAEQKLEKKLNAKSQVVNVEEKKHESTSEKMRKKEQVDEAFHIWLQKKKNQGSQSTKINANVQQHVDNGKAVEERKSRSGPQFEQWLQMKRRQKKKEAEMERMKKKVEMDISYIKNSEQNRIDFNKWSNRKKRELSS